VPAAQQRSVVARKRSQAGQPSGRSVQPARQGVVSSPEIGRSYLFVRPSAAPRVIDGLLGFGGATATTLWSVTRAPEGARLAWMLGIALIGGVVGIEAAGTEVGSFAQGAAYSNGAVALLSLVHPNLTK